MDQAALRDVDSRLRGNDEGPDSRLRGNDEEQVIPANPSVIPANPSVIPANPSVIPANPSVIPAHSIVIPAKAGIQKILLATILFALVSPQALTADIDPATGLVIAPGYEQVKAQCTACHSGRLVAQNRADREGWQQMIRWMQDTQNLWPLGDAEAPILDYLAANYGPLPRGRRAPLDVTFE